VIAQWRQRYCRKFLADSPMKIALTAAAAIAKSQSFPNFPIAEET
jgi:hypothetical protein